MSSVLRAILVLSLAGSCGGAVGDGFDPGSGPNGGSGAGPSEDRLDHEPDPFYNLPTGAEQLKVLCARGNGDRVAKAFCATSTPPAISSIVDLQKLLGIDFKAGNNANGQNGNPSFALSGGSSSLVARFTSAINPRAIVMSPPGNSATNFVAMGFVRGEQFIELVSNDPTKNNELHFFLFKFQHACDETHSCANADLLTPAVESNFSGYTLYEDQDIKNTVFDCLQCHQTGGPSAPKILRQQERVNPWGHWFRNNRVNGQVLIADYQAAHPNIESYGGIPGGAINNSDPQQLQKLVENNGFKTQPNEYSTATILKEVQAKAPNQPGTNMPMGVSAAWQKLYDGFMAGKFIAPPYHDIKVTDPTKLQAATQAYNDVVTGKAAASTLPDIRDVFLDAGLADMGFRPAKSLVDTQDGRGILVQMCHQCHNPSLDQTISRARFDVTKLDTMDRAEKDKAIHRLTLPEDVFRRMPPPRFRALSQQEIDLVVQELKK